MSTERLFTRRSIPGCRAKRTAGSALVITLSLLFLVTIAVVAFFGRTITNQQIYSASSIGVSSDAYTDGAVQAIIGGLQQEMYAGSPSPPPANANGLPTLPMTNEAAIQPSRCLKDTTMTSPNVDPNSDFAKFANLVKQSLSGVPIYKIPANSLTTGSPSIAESDGPLAASSVHTNTPSINGRSHDEKFWGLPQLISSTDTADLQKLIPDWIYTDRGGKPYGANPTKYVVNTNMESLSSNATLYENHVTGRYAYNIYDIGGLLNANVAGYGTGTPLNPTAASAIAQIVPGYKGSQLTADLSGLALNGTLHPGTVTATQIASTLSSWQSKLPTQRYPTGWNTDFPNLLTSGSYGGWLQAFLAPYDMTGKTVAPTTGSPYTLNPYNSRQDLINYVNSQWSSGTNSAQWILPYLTHFSYDTNAPTFTPDPNRPKNTSTLPPQGGNDGGGKDTDPLGINPDVTQLLDVNGNPVIKRRFPLSALALLKDFYPGQPAPSTAVANQIRYDFGLTWDPTSGTWSYQDADKQSATIDRLTSGALKSRSPNLFELLKGMIPVGSLGKQFGQSVVSDPDNVLSSAPPSPYSGVEAHAIQIGTNIISQTTPNYYPVVVNYLGERHNGVKDLPYLYTTRLLQGPIGQFTGAAMHNLGTGSGTTSATSHSILGVAAYQPELWNPHAPNPFALTQPYPTLFRVVPLSGSIYQKTYFGQGGGQNWETGGPTALSGIIAGSYSGAGGPECSTQVKYQVNPANINSPTAVPDAYMQFKAAPPQLDIPSALNSFREPIPLAAPGWPDASFTSSPINPTPPVGGSYAYDGKPNTQFAIMNNAVPAVFGAVSNKTMMGFLACYFCAGPPTGNIGGGETLSITFIEGSAMEFDLQYSIDGTKFYTYDRLGSAAFPGGMGFNFAAGGSQQCEISSRVDPRTNRWGPMDSRITIGSGGFTAPDAPYGSKGNFRPGMTTSADNSLTQKTPLSSNVNDVSNVQPKAPGWTGWSAKYVQTGGAQVNSDGTNQNSKVPASPVYYSDPDGVVRPADGYYNSAGSNPGLPEVMLGSTGSSLPANASSFASRPAVLNRLFQSVAELGYVFRDIPWHSLDFLTPYSADSALLDTFCVYGPDPWSYAPHKYNTANNDASFRTENGLVAGRVDLNTRQQPVLSALLKGAAVSTPASGTTTLTTLTDDQAAKVASSLVAWTTSTDYLNKGPLRNPSELVGKYSGATKGITTAFSGFSDGLTAPLTPPGQTAAEVAAVKQERECVLHALADSGTTRTWNLLIDLVAQTGQLTPNPGPAGLASFVVNGERHVWVSVAIDRATGKIIKIQKESVRL